MTTTLLNIREVSQLTGISIDTLKFLALAGDGPAYTEQDGYLRYSVESVREFQKRRHEAYIRLMAPRVIPASESTPVPRPAWRQALVSKLSPETVPAADIHPEESENREKLARDLARFLFANGTGISSINARRFGLAQWRLARQAVRPGRPVVPSQATIRLSLERLKELETSVPAMRGFGVSTNTHRVGVIGPGLRASA